MPCAEGELCAQPGDTHSCGSDDCLIYCGALPVVLLSLFLFLAFACNIEAGAPGRQGRNCPDVVRAGLQLQL